MVELLPLDALKARAFAAGSGMQQTPKRERPWRRLGYAALLRELARRTGDHASLGRATSAADAAAHEAEGDHEVRALARLDQAETALLTHDLFGSPDAMTAAQGLADLAEGHDGLPATVLIRTSLLRARLAGRVALSTGDVDGLEVAIKALELITVKLAKGQGRTAIAHAADAACDRAEFVLSLAQKLKDRDRLASLEASLIQIAEQLDSDYLPLSFSRAKALRGQVLAALGDLDGSAARLADAASQLAAAAAEVPADHSPLDRARISHAIALTLNALGEACDEDGLFDHAVSAFDQALAALESSDLALRPIVSHDRANTLARRAERRGDIEALKRAETAFKAELRSGDPGRDPVAWATIQLGLARVYQARTRMTGQPSAGAGPALAAAFDVFAERGMKLLAEAAGEGLRELRGA